ncbi:MAG: response regulator [Campylobacteraceae bacterium]|jgi:DNA-binding NtrC family response regulator|nr:response regulator [Campylobacteraceae bacterium]
MIKLMIVDDEAQITSMLQKWFSKSRDFSVTTYNNPEIALSSFSNVKPDVVLLDIMMPQMDGIAVLEKIKSMEPDALVIMMTAYSTLDRVLSSHRQGAESYILKPFESLSAVEEKVRAAYDKKAKK